MAKPLNTTRPTPRALCLAGCACWLIVVLVHIAEREQLFPAMGWGLPDSPGHYLDLFGPVGGGVLLLVAFLMHRFSK